MRSTQVRQPLDQVIATQDPFLNIEVGGFGPAAPNLVTQASGDSGQDGGSNRSGEGPSSRGDSWDQSNGLEELDKRQGSLGAPVFGT